MKETDRRILWIDYSKAICMYLVVLGHSQFYYPAHPVTIFNMPLFFFLSGCLFSFDKHLSFKEFAIKRFKGIMVPYLYINLITYLFWLLIGRHFGDDSSAAIPWYSPLMGIFTGMQKMVHNPPMWFFMCLYFLELIYYLVFKPLHHKGIAIKILMLGIVAAAGFINYTYNPYLLPFFLNTALTGMIFYGIGNIVTQKKSIKKIKPIHILLAFATLAVIVVITHTNGYIIMADNKYNNYLLFLIGSLAGIYFIWIVTNILSTPPFDFGRSLFVQISKNTLVINSFHLIAFSFLKGIMVFILHIPVESIYGKALPNIILAGIALFLCIPLAQVINSYFPFILGKKRVEKRA